MKCFLLLFFVFSSLTHALPVLDENAAGSGNLATIWRDHRDNSLFYYAPSSYRNSHSEKDIRVTVGGTFEAVISEDSKEAMAEILMKDPEARFEPVPMRNLDVLHPDVFSEFILEEKCKSESSNQLISCQLVMDGNSFDVLLPILRTSGIPLHVVYEIDGLVRGGKGRGIRKKTISFSVPLIFKGDF